MTLNVDVSEGQKGRQWALYPDDWQCWGSNMALEGWLLTERPSHDEGVETFSLTPCSLGRGRGMGGRD